MAYNYQRCQEYKEIESMYEDGLISKQEQIDKLKDHYVTCKECKTGLVKEFKESLKVGHKAE